MGEVYLRSSVFLKGRFGQSLLRLIVLYMASEVTAYETSHSPWIVCWKLGKGVNLLDLFKSFHTYVYYYYCVKNSYTSLDLNAVSPCDIFMALSWKFPSQAFKMLRWKTGMSEFSWVDLNRPLSSSMLNL